MVDDGMRGGAVVRSMGFEKRNICRNSEQERSQWRM